jgi:hypothetical protein
MQTPIPAEVIEEALRTFNEKEIAEGITEIQKTGGFQLSDICEELEQMIIQRKVVA